MTRVVIWGAGAIGGVLGAWLARAGHDVLLVDSNREHVEAIQTRGVTVTGVRGTLRVRVPAALPEDVRSPLELVLLAVKCQHTDPALDRIEPLLAHDGSVVSMQNGLNEEVIARRIGAPRTLGCFVHFSADWQSPGVIEHGGEHPIFVGELDGSRTERVERVRALLGQFCETQVTDNIWGFLWSKLAFASMLFATALVDAPINDILRRPGVGVLMYRLVQEALAVPRTLGVRLEDLHGFRPGDYEGEDWRRPIEGVARFYDGQIKVKSGIWRDLAVRHRPTEVACQLGKLVEKGGELGLRLPLNTCLIELIRQLEEGSRPMAWQNLDELAASAAGSGG